MSMIRDRRLAVLLVALAAMLAGCGDDNEEGDAAPSDAAEALDPAAVEASVQEYLEEDEQAGKLSPAVDCGDEAAERLECSITGDKGLTGAVAASPSQGFKYTGEIEGPDGPSSLGGSESGGAITDPAAVEASLNEILADNAGAPTANCPDTAEGDSLECEVAGEGVSGTLTIEPLGGFEWSGQVETPDGTRGIGANELP